MPSPPTPVSLRLAQVVSVLFHPLFLPLAFAWHRHHGDPMLPRMMGLILVLLIVVPGCISLVWMWIRREENWMAISQSNRVLPMVTGLLGLGGLVLASLSYLPEHLMDWQLIGLLGLQLGIALVVNVFWKISVHLMGCGAVTAVAGEVGILEGVWIVLPLSVLLAVLVGWARIRVGSHDVAQVVAGYAAGVLSASVCLQWL